MSTVVSRVKMDHEFALLVCQCRGGPRHMRVQERVLDQCQPCAAGSFRNDTLDRACYACGLDEYQDTTGQTQCKSCPPHSYTEATGSNSVLLCLCESGYEWDETSQTCVECTAGTSKGRGAGTCQQCPEDSFALARSGQCTACGPNERAPAGSGSPFACNCRPGFGSADSGGSCSICGNGTFSGGGTGAAVNSPQVQRPSRIVLTFTLHTPFSFSSVETYSQLTCSSQQLWLMKGAMCPARPIQQMERRIFWLFPIARGPLPAPPCSIQLLCSISRSPSFLRTKLPNCLHTDG